MRSQNLKFFKPLYSRSKTFNSVDVAFDFSDDRKLVASLNHSGGTSVPFAQGYRHEVIEEVERVAADLGIPINHPLTQPVIVLMNQYALIEGQWVWHRRFVSSFKNADEAYLELRSMPLEISDGKLVSVTDGSKTVVDGSQHCEDKWAMIIYRLKNNGECPAPLKMNSACPRCFSFFVSESMCLECGYE